MYWLSISLRKRLGALDSCFPFRILVVDGDSPSGDQKPAKFTRTVRYNGKAQTIQL